MNCSSPIDAALLADYWLAALDPAREEAVEEHLLGCDPCGARLRDMIALAGGIRRLASEGSLRMIVSDTFLRCAADRGLRVRQYSPAAGGSVQCTVTAEDDLLVGRMAADLSGARRVDLSICDGSGVEQARLADIPVSPRANCILLQESITSARAAPTGSMIMRLLGVGEGGEERLLGEYTFHHTRSLPGPGAG
jgi:hypothetical protein